MAFMPQSDLEIHLRAVEEAVLLPCDANEIDSDGVRFLMPPKATAKGGTGVAHDLRRHIPTGPSKALPS
jgi:hypothetical protein